MKKIALASFAVLSLSAVAFAAQPNTYQVTGAVLETSDSTITVEKGKEKWEIAKGDAEGANDVKKGDKVTITYRMTASKIEVKPAAGAKKAAAPKTDAPAATTTH
jgi:hypothetical protein